MQGGAVAMVEGTEHRAAGHKLMMLDAVSNKICRAATQLSSPQRGFVSEPAPESSPVLVGQAPPFASMGEPEELEPCPELSPFLAPTKSPKRVSSLAQPNPELSPFMLAKAEPCFLERFQHSPGRTPSSRLHSSLFTSAQAQAACEPLFADCEDLAFEFMLEDCCDPGDDICEYSVGSAKEEFMAKVAGKKFNRGILKLISNEYASHEGPPVGETTEMDESELIGLLMQEDLPCQEKRSNQVAFAKLLWPSENG